MNSASPNMRWIQLLLGLVCMIVISSPQYVWALFTQPLTTGLGASLPELQITFSILIVVQTFLSPWQGVLVDRFGPRLLLSIGVLVTGLSCRPQGHELDRGVVDECVDQLVDKRSVVAGDLEQPRHRRWVEGHVDASTPANPLIA